MICPNCNSTEGSYDEVWDEYWDGEDYDSCYSAWWDCHNCEKRAMSYEEGYEAEE